MFSTSNRVVRFKRKPPPHRIKKFVFPTIVITLAVSVFATIIYWPIISLPKAQTISETFQTVQTTTAATYKTYVAPTQTTRHTTQHGEGTLFKCTVTSVYDGDGPIHCREGVSIRLHAIAAREMDETCRRGHPCPNASGASAKRELQSLALGHTLSCEQIGTSYNRVTAICWTKQNLELNCAMVRSGKAALWPSYDRRRRICS